MRKVLISVCFILFAVVGSAQLTINGNYLLMEKKNGVRVIIFDSITSESKIDYRGQNVKFFKYNNPTATFLLPPDDATGYTVEVNGISTDTIFVIDYSNYRPSFSSLELESNGNSQCENMNLLLTGNIPALKYQTPSGTSYTLTRDFNVKYKTMEFVEEWNTIDTTVTITLPSIALLSHRITVNAPLCDTYFTLSGDQYANKLDKLDSITSLFYSAVAVKCYPTFIVEKREGLHEAERPFLSSQLKFSAPLSCEFKSNANEPVAKFYKWEIFKDKQLLISRSDKDHRYTFTEAGIYNIKLKTSNDKLPTSNLYCSNTDSVSITISESSLLVPNVFTPNGDLQNDEFRVAYKSIISFQAWVYNRWGRKVFSWTDPQKGWDGNINGKKAVPGPYFYVIKATGSDGIKYLKKGDINLLRGVDK